MVNAIKFTPDGGTIRLIAGPDGPDWVRFRVVDQGLGIGPAERRHLFEPFFTGFDTMHHSSGEYQYRKRGIGLGLCLVKTFAELHGGRVEVDSAPGSRLGVRIPPPQASARRAIPAATRGLLSAPDHPASGSGLRSAIGGGVGSEWSSMYSRR